MDATSTRTHEVLQSAEFKRLIVRRWTVSAVLCLLLFVLYYGYILLIGYAKPLLAAKAGVVTTWGIVAGVSVIVLSWLLTVIYVVWANRYYDPQVEAFKAHLRHPGEAS